tara:strand:+ start:3934 stop:4380 length:447 start_codon:yes stop_codon:yes gene_type:complete
MKIIFSLLMPLFLTSVLGQFEKDSLIFYFKINDKNVHTLTVNKKVIEKAKAISLGQNPQLIGFADTLGTDRYNRNLASERIQNVQIVLGNEFKKIKTTVIGETNMYGEQANNRCVVLIYDKKVKTNIEEGSVVKTLDTLILNLIFFTQ